MAVDVHGTASCSSPRLHVSPAITHHEAVAQIEPEICAASNRSPERAYGNGIRRRRRENRRRTPLPELLAQLPIDLVDHLYLLLSSCDVGLICHDNQDKSRGL